MNANEIKTRYGLILQGVTKAALRRTRLNFRENWSYHPDYERPDFTIPDDDHPKFALEVHQTDARNSFQMKTLRAFTAVAEAKLFFGDSIMAVNILFGNPDIEIPASNVRALCGFFDMNLLPGTDAPDGLAIRRMEADALELASNEDLSVAGATAQLLRTESEGFVSLTALLDEALRKPPSINRLMLPIWRAERQRAADPAPIAPVGETTSYKRAILQSLYLSDEHFAELLEKSDPNRCSPEVQVQLVATKLAEVRQSLLGDILSLGSTLRQFLGDPEGPRLRGLCEKRLEEEPAMHWFFEDIRDPIRRQQMVACFLNLLREGREGLVAIVEAFLRGESYGGVEHTRCWVADLMPLAVGESHNSFNGRMYRHPTYTQTLGNPFNNITIRSPRLGTNSQILSQYADVAVSCFYEACREHSIEPADVDPDELSQRLTRLRINGAPKLQKLNPLYLSIESVALELGLEATYRGTPSLLSDLSGSADPVGKYDLYHISDSARSLIVNAIAVHDHHGDDKSKEWGGRRRSTLYRLSDQGVQRSMLQNGLFVVDGEWDQKDLSRLYRSGWNYVVRLGELEDTLKSFFGTEG